MEDAFDCCVTSSIRRASSRRSLASPFTGPPVAARPSGAAAPRAGSVDRADTPLAMAKVVGAVYLRRQPYPPGPEPAGSSRSVAIGLQVEESWGWSPETRSRKDSPASALRARPCLSVGVRRVPGLVHLYPGEEARRCPAWVIVLLGVSVGRRRRCRRPAGGAAAAARRRRGGRSAGPSDQRPDDGEDDQADPAKSRQDPVIGAAHDSVDPLLDAISVEVIGHASSPWRLRGSIRLGSARMPLMTCCAPWARLAIPGSGSMGWIFGGGGGFGSFGAEPCPPPPPPPPAILPIAPKSAPRPPSPPPPPPSP